MDTFWYRIIQDLQEAAAFKELLHIVHGVFQRDDGAYRGRRQELTLEDVAAHLKGEVAIAFCVNTKEELGYDRLARFICYDIDQRAEERLPIFRAVLEELGFEKAVFLTGGSSPGKAKIIICFRKPVPLRYATALAEYVYELTYKRDASLIPPKPTKGDLEVFPRPLSSGKHEAGVVRILGRNVGKNGPLETPTDLSGVPLESLSQIDPLSVERIDKIARRYMWEHRDSEALPRTIQAMIESQWTY